MRKPAPFAKPTTANRLMVGIAGLEPAFSRAKRVFFQLNCIPACRPRDSSKASGT